MSDNRFDMLELGDEKPKVEPNQSVFTNVASLQPKEGATAKQVDGQWVNAIGLQSTASHRHVAKVWQDKCSPLADFIETKALIGSGVGADDFWAGFSDMAVTQGAKNRALLAKRDALQTQIDNWHIAHRNAPHDPAAYKAFLQEIGYLSKQGRFEAPE